MQMRIESSITAVTWIPSEAIEGMPKLPFELGLTHYDEPPPDRIENLDKLREADAFREANELIAWIEVENGRIVDHGREGRGLIGVTRLKVGPKTLAFPAVAFPLLQPEPEVGDGWVRFVQTAGGRMGLPAPRRVRGKPYFQIARSRGTGSTTPTGTSPRSRERSTSRGGTASRTARTRPGAARTRPRS
ncbi:MAG: putative transcriptional regulator, Crp/Fnr family [Gaiellaceae bacterium]|nr:putative transcriptional regulator, Crp/Fnr family [Gaiellaceae bacterium]